MASAMAAKMRRQRERWHELDEPARRALRLRRPLMAKLAEYGRFDEAKLLQLVAEAVVDWRGFTEADLLGDGIGASDEVPFDAEAFAEWAGDNPELISAAAVSLIEAINALNKQQEADGKNSATS